MLERVRTGDGTAFAELVDRHHGSLVRLAAMFATTSASAQEVAQETWLAAMNGIRQFEGRSSIKTWLLRIVVNRAKTRAVKEGRSLPFSAVGGDAAQEDEGSPVDGRFDGRGMWADPPRAWAASTPEELFSRGEAARALTAALDDLPAKYRAIVTMRDVDELSSEEVCNILEISASSVCFSTGRARLR